MYVSICVIPRDGKESQMCLKHNKLMRIVHVFSVLIVFCRFCVVSPIMSNKLQNLKVYSTLSLQCLSQAGSKVAHLARSGSQ